MRYSIILLLFLLSLSASNSLNAQNPSIADTVVADTSIFFKVETEAGFPGGDAAWKKFLEKNLNGSVPSNNGAPVGFYRVLIQFVVSKEGFVSEVKPLTNFGYGMEAEVMRIIKKSGAWTPAEQAGRKVKAYRTQPVIFMLETDAFTINTSIPFTLVAGEDNEITVDAGRSKPGNIRLTISKGVITSLGDGRFNVKVTGKGRVTINVYDKNKNLGAASFEVKGKGE